MQNNLFDHLLVTRFSYRGAGSCSVEIDPLDRHRLEKRFDLFEAVCLPSILAQREKHFSWILIIDARLPQIFRERLDRLVEEHGFIRLHVYSSGTNIERLGWLDDYFSAETDYVITTVLDDDDALCSEFVANLHEYVRALASTDGLPELKVFGCTSAIQWDFYPARQSPLGYLKPWSRRRESAGALPLQSGFSALSRKGGLDFSAYFFRHSLGDLFLIADEKFDRLSAATQERIQFKRDALKKAVARSGQDWNHLCAQGVFREVLAEQTGVLMVNTMTNLQTRRLFEYPERRAAVIDASSFPGFGIDLEAAGKSIPVHGCTLPNFLASVLPAYKAAFQGGIIGSPTRFAAKFRQAVKMTLRSTRSILALRK